ncbi:MAG: acetylglutamate kinase [Elusimicrobiota bacterium]
MKNKNIIVIKFGGSVFNDPLKRRAFLMDIEIAGENGFMPVIVHGGGKDVSSWFDKVGIQVKFVNGLRYTDENSMELVEMVLSGKVNKHIVGELQKTGAKSVGISGRDADFIIARRKQNFGYVGTIKKVDCGLLNLLLKNQYVPVVSSICSDGKGGALNVNADEAAFAIAAALRAKKLIFVSDIPGVLKDVNDESSIIKEINAGSVAQMVKKGIISGGMVPKLESAKRALGRGVGEVDIVDGRVKGILKKCLESTKIMGTRLRR